MKKVSAVIIAYNESANIEQVLHSVLWCDEVVVVDSGSTDDTAAKAESLGARVVYHPFEGFGKQKAFAVSQARNHWVLSVDADEVVTPELRKSIEALPEECRMSGYHITRIDQFNGKVLKHSLGSCGSLIRLFDRRHGNFSTLAVHEAVEIEGRTGKLKGPVLHRSYTGISSYFEKFNRYTSLAAQVKFDQGKRTTPLQVLVRFPLALADSLIAKRGFLDGYEGVLMGIFHAFYSVVKYAKLLELQSRS